METALGLLIGPEYRYELCAARCSIGRAPDNDICLEPKTISSRHAIVEFAIPRTGHLPRDGAVLYDVGSTNGTWVNEQHIKQGSIPLESGDIIRFGYDVDWYRFFYAADMDVAVRGSGNLPGDLGAFSAMDKPLKDFASPTKKANAMLSKPDTKKPPAVTPAPVSKANLTSRQKPDPGPSGPSLVRRSQTNLQAPQTSPRRAGAEPSANRSPRKTRPATSGSPEKGASSRPGVQYPPFPKNSSTLVPAPEKASLEESIAKSAAASGGALEGSFRRHASAPGRGAGGRRGGALDLPPAGPHGEREQRRGRRRGGPSGAGAGAGAGRVAREDLDRMEATLKVGDRGRERGAQERPPGQLAQAHDVRRGGGGGGARGGALGDHAAEARGGGAGVGPGDTTAEAARHAATDHRQAAAAARLLEELPAAAPAPPAGPSSAAAGAGAGRHGPREVDMALFPVADGAVQLRLRTAKLRHVADALVARVTGQQPAGPPGGDPSAPTCEEIMGRPLQERAGAVAAELLRVERLLPSATSTRSPAPSRPSGPPRPAPPRLPP
eukprot:tig00000367_g24481.t1